MIRKNSSTYFILLGLEKTIQTWVKFNDYIYHPGAYVYSNYPRKLNYGALYQALKDLREKGYVDITKDKEGKILIKLTKEGKKEVLIKRILEDKKWDGKWRIVIFDIPEKHRKLRNALRWKLREWEFEIWQKSVWATKKDIVNPLRDFIKELGLSQWVRVMVTEDIKLY